jgi:predicted nucleic acid-binding protein
MLIDTSVWVDHLRRGNRALERALEKTEVWCHPFVQGELACGNLRNREEILSLLGALPHPPTLSHDEALTLVDRWNLTNRGLGWIDIHILGSALLGGLRLWTLDRTLATAARRLGLGVS